MIPVQLTWRRKRRLAVFAQGSARSFRGVRIRSATKHFHPTVEVRLLFRKKLYVRQGRACRASCSATAPGCCTLHSFAFDAEYANDPGCRKSPPSPRYGDAWSPRREITRHDPAIAPRETSVKLSACRRSPAGSHPSSSARRRMRETPRSTRCRRADPAAQAGSG